MPRISVRPFSTALRDKLIQEGSPRLLAQLYSARGVGDTTQSFSSLASLDHFSGMLNIDAAAIRLADAIAGQQRILVVGDFDCDGATSTAVAVSGLMLLGAQHVDFLVPHRTLHGYGLSPKLVETASTMKPDLIVTVDNGISAEAGVSAAQARGIDVIVTDHHLPGDTLPACILVDPNQAGCPHPGKHLAGVGVMFYVLGALKAELVRRGIATQSVDLSPLLDLVALGTVADVVKLDANNRLLVKAGLERIRSGRTRPGIMALFEIAKRELSLATADDFGFAIGPRLNAAGRLDDMAWGIKCLLAPDLPTARHYAEELDRMNQARKGIEADMQAQADVDLDSVVAGDGLGHSLVMHNGGWHPGVVGLLASRIKEAYTRPTLVFTDAEPGLIKGSGRSIPGFHLRDALDLVNKRTKGEVIVKFGGHAMAAGLTVHAHRLADLRVAFEQVAREWLPAGFLDEEVVTDGSLEPAFLNVAELTPVRAAVWGQGFPYPSFVGEFEVSSQTILKGAHSKLDATLNGVQIKVMLFNNVDPVPPILKAVYRPVLNTYRGNTSVEAIVERLI